MKKKNKPVTNKDDPNSFKKHRGNPHGNAPERGGSESSTISDDKLRAEAIDSSKLKQ